jgi:hypothetical protein
VNIVYLMDKIYEEYDDDDIDDYLDTKWITDVRNNEVQYNKYYVFPVNRMNIFFVCIHGDMLSMCEKRSIMLDKPNVLMWEEMLPLVNGYVSQGYVMSKRLKYNMAASPEDILKGNWLSSCNWYDVGTSSDIYFGDTTCFMHDVLCVVCFMIKRVNNIKKSIGINSTTRRVYMDVGVGRSRSVTRKKR